MKIVKKLLKKNPCYTSNRNIGVRGLMLHSVGCPQPRAKVFISQWNSPKFTRACVHAFIDAVNGKVYQTLPWNHRGWHCGGSGNSTHIGVEMCEPNCIKYTSGSSFSVSDKKKAVSMAIKTYTSAVELFAWLCVRHNLDPLKKGVIVSHKEGCSLGIATNHGDPEHLWKGLGLDYTMDTFRKDVKKEMAQLKYEAVGSNTSPKNYDDIAREVIAGKWGTGVKRKNLLEKAGYNYAKVQSKVNQILKG